MSDREMGFEKISLGESMKMAFSFQKKGKDTQKSKSQSIYQFVSCKPNWIFISSLKIKRLLLK